MNATSAQLRRIAAQVRKWNLGVVTPPHHNLDPVRVTFANVRSGVRGGRFRNVRVYRLTLVDLMCLAEIVRVRTHPVRVAS